MISRLRVSMLYSPPSGDTYPGVDYRVQDVLDQVGQYEDHREEDRRAEYRRVVVDEDGAHEQVPDAGNREDLLDDYGARYEPHHEREQHRDERYERVTQHVLPDHRHAT